MKNNLAKILEIVWLITGILAIGAGIHQTIREGIEKSWLFFLISVISFAMYFFKRKMRKILENK